MADVTTYCKNGQQIKNGGVVLTADKKGNHQYIGPSGINGATPASVYTYLEVKYSGRFDHPTYYG